MSAGIARGLCGYLSPAIIAPTFSGKLTERRSQAPSMRVSKMRLENAVTAQFSLSNRKTLRVLGIVRVVSLPGYLSFPKCRIANTCLGEFCVSYPLMITTEMITTYRSAKNGNWGP